MSGRGFTHLDPLGRSRASDLIAKEATHRRAVARGRVVMQPATTSLVAKGAVRRGQPVKVLGDGGVSVAMQVSVNAFSSSAKEKLSAAGGAAIEV